MRNLGGFARNRGWGWVLGWPKQQMSALASCTRVVQSKQNNQGLVSCSPELGLTRESSPEHGCGASETEALRKPGFWGSPRRAASRLMAPHQAGLTWAH